MGNNIKAPTRNESRKIKFMILLGIFSILNFLFFFFKQEHRVNSFLFGILAIVIFYGVLKKLYMWYNYSNISVPKPPEVTPEFTVDVLTTYFPGEPYEMITTTLKAIKNIHYPHTTYLCDEANDPFLKEFCEQHEIVHVTRDNRKDAKAGNINNALRKHATGDICVILDPDHIPQPDFLDPILPHFTNPKIGFVQIVQSYYNIEESLVARGAAEQTFQFYGPMMMTLNSYGAVNAIGANCVFRRSALDSIGGHAPGLCEDMHTAMLLYAEGWEAVYVPQVLAKGLAPSNLTNFFKQQLKWSRGSFDLWLKVYPKIFRKLTNRQKIHYGILPMHYLSGLIILFTFLIPILSLLFSTYPWRGNIIDFFLVLLPVAASAVLIRTYIQKWVIEKKERGFHIVGGLLHINTWWIYLLGLIYTILNKKVPYLPTPKEDDFKANLKIVLPNAIIAGLSIFAVVYGLYRDFTPFSIIMSFFALFNAGIMMFGIYVTMRLTNQNRILRTHLKKEHLLSLSRAKKGFYRLANSVFVATRTVALPVLLVILIIAMSFKEQNDESKWEEVLVPLSKSLKNDYLGIFLPSEGNGLTDIEAVNELEQDHNVDFDIISLYLPWTDESIKEFPHQLMQSVYARNKIPMITWEPWASTLAANDSVQELQNEKKIFKHILDGKFDNYIREFAQILKSQEKPVFLRFAHEFDNPQYPWSSAGGNTPEEFKAAWKHVYRLIKEEEAHKVILVWNPWKPDTMQKYYPGDEYVDWIGITLLDYSPLGNIKNLNFNELYLPFKEKLYWFTRKPVMLAEFGSLKSGASQQKWLQAAVDTINQQHEEISALVFFNSALDKNIPSGTSAGQKNLDWSIESWEFLDNKYGKAVKNDLSEPLSEIEVSKKTPITSFDIKGVRYKKGTSWKNNYYTLTKVVLEKDFRQIKAAGINTIQATGGNIYDHNLLLYSAEADLQLIYQFNIDQTLDFINERDKLKELEKDILDKVDDLRDKENIIGYSFDLNLQEHYTKPALFDQRTAYLKWLQSLTQKIKRIDPETPITLDLQLDSETGHLLEFLSNRLPVDSYGLVAKDPEYIQQVLKRTKEQGISVFISSLKPELLTSGKANLESTDFILENWQDERQSNWMTFDGLVDFRGRRKEVLRDVANYLHQKNVEKTAFSSRIIRPAEPLYPGQIYSYHAAVFNGESWSLHGLEDEHKFEWNLVKTDAFGNPLAVKKLGTKPNVDVIIPQSYENYEIMLTTRKKDSEYVTTTRTSLHTPEEIR
ncbi:Glycosyltransferase, catalytic subunit of cellulose synthase and poly-beta-1,6-N-acetylglucosamine synthase [Salinimicrobium catena]|uniref:Glycosyltransferase, catalytic subunit of cellulose synthase and poly-beta-1,6-N-acetylglucosamine synthase n=1 Tax=Salinimicrobium catena TaxID=390640 RepID=A0A1H5NIY8_9FLAO|nr:glycosyltransferase family 2 protein [Salinimicrobium catena]SDL46186.1 Glycosyltransferase, catalytic subunit of cellulose synthase and poly-beta-1,6-N-acetylglucosamine synthase [Salinimicrobium catena]SEF00797.1 Glycosyltransferase, catalytic subunit of cellulose synthase and poly-beta-1,6-N-acetylglucosamine synthase [Salinimicrobium catena]